MKHESSAPDGGRAPANPQASGKCPACGAWLPAGELAGLCPACLLKQGAGPDTAGAKPFDPPSVAEIARLFPNLQILGLLGKGGMGAVYKARQAGLERFVALKVLPARGDPGFAERFAREARALARLSHPNIIGVHEFGRVEGLHYFIMEFVDGVNLRQLEQNGRLSPREALQLVPQICDALQYAHDEGVVHRDIKPENVLVDRKGRVKIADFGLAKILGAEPEVFRLTAEGQVMGTPHYMAPEQVESPAQVDHRADIFSLGVVFYELLTGELPLGKFAPPSNKVQMDVRLDEVVLHALEHEPERRYQQARLVKTDLETISRNPPGAAPPEPGPLPAAAVPRLTGGRWQGAAIACVLLLLLGGALVLAFWYRQKDSSAPTLLHGQNDGIVPPSGLVAWWPFDDNANDSAGNAPGTLEGQYTFTPAEVGDGLSLEGPRSGVAVPDRPELNFGPGVDFSIEGWIRPLEADTDFDDMDIVDKRVAPDIVRSHGYDLGLRNGRLSFQISDSLNSQMLNWEQNGPDLRDGAWHHVAVSVQRAMTSGVQLFVDGQVVATFDPTSAQGDLTTDQPLLIGMHPSFPSFRGNFRGGVDEVSIYRRALAAPEIHAIYAAGQHGKRKPFRGSIGPAPMAGRPPARD